MNADCPVTALTVDRDDAPAGDIDAG